MSVLVVGMSHQSAPVALLERLSMDDGVQNDACSQLLRSEALSEVMIISTCNRMEVYAVTNSFHTGVQTVVDVLHEISGVDEDELRGYLYVRYADAAVEHLMTVAAGLDSMVVGEQQIIGQVRSAYQKAAEQGSAGPRIHALAQSALRTGKRVHTETDIDEAGASMVSYSFDRALGLRGWQDLRGKRVLVLGAGAMASLAATHAGRLGASALVISNRTFERAQRLADHAAQAGVCAEVVPFEQRTAALKDVDLAVSATGASEYTIEAGDLPDRELTLIDLSMPRDIEDACGKRSGVELVNIERLSQGVRDGGMSGGPQAQARTIVLQELDAFSSAQRVRDVAPAVSALRKHAADVVECEIARLEHKHPELDDEQREDISRALKRAVDKLLHEPTVRAKQLAATEGTVSHETALQELFGLRLSSPSKLEEGVKVDVDELPKSI